MSLPAQTPEQLAEGRRKALETRHARSAALARIRAGSVSFADVVADEDSPLQSAKVWQVVRAVPGVGDVKAARLLSEAGVTPEFQRKRRVRGLGPNQRKALAEALAG